ncbi:MAG TPA: M23 family metallopeptidase [Candidatus Colwellbacteria bacterium]|nr:M23 family metallopeptidase [Candidatus Colwellbacteria bacterium]
MANFFIGIAEAANGMTSSSGILQALDSLIPGGLSNLFVFAWELGGFIAFLIIVWAGFQYTLRANNPAARLRSRNMIIEAAWGLGILATSYIIISTINPDLLQFKIDLPSIPKLSEGSVGSGDLIQLPIGQLAWPTQGRQITSPFGMRDGRMHNGIDIGVNSGTPVYAAADGVVSYAGYDSDGYGNYIILEHSSGYTTLYGHLLSLGSAVDVGEEVARGQQIALSGSTGRSSGPHLHFEIRLNNNPINPLAGAPSFGGSSGDSN